MIKKNFGYAKRLTEAQDLKSAIFEDVKTIIFDEYGIEKSRRHYLPDEAMIFASIIDSVVRNRSDIRIFILSNATNDLEYSPLFSFFDLSIPYNKDIKLFKNNIILVQYMNNEAFRLERKETLIGKLFDGTRYENYAMQNKIQDRSNDFIEKKTGSAKFSFAIIYNENIFGIWNDYKEGKVFISLDYDKNSDVIFSMTTKDHKPNIMLFNAIKKFNFWRNFTNNYKMRCSLF